MSRLEQRYRYYAFISYNHRDEREAKWLQRQLEHYRLPSVARKEIGEDIKIRPVFRYVDDLIRAGEFTNLKGMIYFTDGQGVFPDHPPAYDAAFVFVNDDYVSPDVPVWAIKLVLQREEL